MNPPPFHIQASGLFGSIKKSRDKADGVRLVQRHLQDAYKGGYEDAQAAIRDAIGAASPPNIE